MDDAVSPPTAKLSDARIRAADAADAIIVCRPDVAHASDFSTLSIARGFPARAARRGAGAT